MALSLIQFQSPADNAFFYGVLKQGVSQDQIFKALQSDPVNIDEPSEILRGFLYISYTFSDYLDFISFSNGEDCGTLYAVNYYSDIVGVQKINNGLGGVSVSDRDDTNTVETVYTIADYTFSSEIFASPNFMPGEFLTGVVSPLFAFASTNLVVLALLSVTFVKFGTQILRRVVGAFGRGR